MRMKRGLRRLSAQIRAGKLVIRLYLKSPHAKLYLVHRHDVQALLGLPLKIYQGIHFSGVDNPLTLTGREVHFLLACLITRKPEDPDEQTILDLYHEKSGVLDGDEDSEVDLTSEAYQIWKNAIDADPALKQKIENLLPVVYSTRAHPPIAPHPEGVLIYLKTAEGNDSLALVDREGRSVTQSQLAILRMAQCHPDTPAIPRDGQHHQLVEQGAKLILDDEKSKGGQLGRPSGARFRTYERLKRYAQAVKGTSFESQDLLDAIDTIYRHPLRQGAIDQLNRQLKSGIDDAQLAGLVVALHLEERLCLIHEEDSSREPQIICSMGLFDAKK